MRYELSDDEWTAIKPMLPSKPRGVPRVNDRRVLNGIFWVLRSGAPWRDLPNNFGPYTTCYNRFVRWRRAGVWAKIMSALAEAHDVAVQMIDTSIVRVHQHGSCITRNRRQSMGRSRGGLTSKLHALVDANGLPVRLAVTPGEAHDNRLAGKLLSRLRAGSMLLADRGYDADWIRELAAANGAWANIPPKSNRSEPICFSPYLYHARNRVERFFNKIKHCRRVATRYDKLAANYLAFVQLASIRLWLRANESTSYPAEPTEQFRCILRMGATPNGIYGLKVFPSQHGAIAPACAWTELLPNLRFVWLQRRDLLGQAISFARASRTGQFRSTVRASASACYDADLIRHGLVMFVKDQARWALFFARTGITALPVYYEDIVANPQGTVDRIAALVGLREPAPIRPELIEFRVQREAATEEWRARFLRENGDRDAIDQL